MENKYLISIVMAIYNSEPFLRETLDSVVNQNISRFEMPFEKIVQVIMVDDGSTDGTAEIIDEYAENFSNFLAVHKENGGVASARNEGLKHVEGKYMNFLDSDDKFSENVLWEMYSFFEEHYDETDVVTMPLFFFDAASGQHWQNGKFKNGCRVINLYREYDASLMFVNASFFKSEYKDKVFFDGNLVCGEDIKYIYTILSDKMTMGVINRCRYLYRRRSVGEESLIQASKKKRGWYFQYFTHLVDWGIKFSIDKFGYAPQYIQNLFAMDLSWRFRENYEKTALNLLGEDDFENYKRILFKSLKYLDDDIILRQKNIYIEHKIFMLSKKYGRLPDQVSSFGDIGLTFADKPFYWLSDFVTLIDFLKIDKNTLTIEGYTMLAGISDEEAAEVKLIVKKPNMQREILSCKTAENRSVSQYRLGETLFRGIPFIGNVTLNQNEVKAEISLAVFIRGNLIIKKDIRFKEFSPIGQEFNNSHYVKDGYMVTRFKHCIYFEKCSRDEKKKRDERFMLELKNSKKESDKKAYKALTAYKILKKLLKKKIWLVIDRWNMADDNGEALFRYLCREKPKNTDVYFVVDKNYPDYEGLSKIGKVVPCFSHKHKMLHLLAEVIISSQADDYVLNPFSKFSPPYRQFLFEQKVVFLQHGITTNNLSPWLNRFKKPLCGFVTSAKKERDSILRYDYFYENKEIWLTGFPRYDLLYNNPQKYITVMPTWRANLSGNAVKLKNSEYYKFFTGLLSDTRLLSAAKQQGYKICTKLHPRMEEDFDLSKDEILCFEPNEKYRDIFAKSCLLVTDFSSVAFDFAYLKKPLIYAQFDADTFYDGQLYEKGYFDYERDGFGEVTYDLDSTVDLIIDYMKNGCQLKEKYRERIDSFFAFNDKNNCERVYKRITEMLEEKCSNP